MHATHCTVYLREMHITFPEAFEKEKAHEPETSE